MFSNICPNYFLVIIILINIQLCAQTISHQGCYRCDNKKQCVSYRFECDGKYDCDDHSDEKECENKKPEECIPPVIANGDYRLLGNNGYYSRKPIPNLAIVNITCDNANYHLSTPYSTITCINGQFLHEVPKCIFTQSCTTAFPYSIDVNCKLDENDEYCTQSNVPVGTKAYVKCKPNFIDKNPEITSVTCFADGIWYYDENTECENPKSDKNSNNLKVKCMSNGSWQYTTFKECVSPYKCPARPSTTINVYCDLNGVVQDCSKEVPEGTYSRMTCKPNYIDVNDGPTVATCINGTWTRPIKKCIPDCNRIVHAGQTNIVNGSSASRGDFPWHVAIYRQKPEEPRDYICGGSLISVKVVLSAAHCFTDQNNGKVYSSTEFSVAAGKTYNNWDADEDEYYVQKRNVTSIHILDDIYFGLLSNFAGDLAVVVVDKIFTFSNFVNAVCVDWNSEYLNQQLLHGSLAKVAGWGATTTGNPFASVKLRHLRVPYVKRYKCVKIVPKNFLTFVTTDKFCAGYTNGSSVCNGDSGGGLIFSHYDKNQIMKYYIQGIVSVGPTKEGACDDFQLGVYTEIKNYISFIKEIEESNRMNTSVDCVVPKIRNGKVNVSGLDYLPGSVVKESFEVTVECDSGYNLSANNLPKCIGGQWSIGMPTCENETESVTFAPPTGGECPSIIFENGRYFVTGKPYFIPRKPIPNYAIVNFRCKNDSYTLTTFHDNVFCLNGQFQNELPKCVLSCAARSSTTSVDIKCDLNGVDISCSKRVPEGTIATMKCKPYYSEPVRGPSTAVCMNGSWTEDLIKCILECGELGSNALIANSTNYFPWHVGIFRKRRLIYKYRCGGSLISEKIVLTAAHCVANYTNGRLFPRNEFTLIKEDFFGNVTFDEPHYQDRKISKIEKPNIIFGADSNYVADIAVVVVDRPFIFTEYIRPVCVDWTSKLVGTHLRNGAIGQITRWPQTSLDLLKKITVPYIDREQCLKIAPPKFRTYITNDKYCGGYTNESSLCGMDRGSGLVFAQDEFKGKKYYIQGVVSYGPSSVAYCDTNAHQIGVFTRVAFYTDEIKEIVALNIK